MKIKPVKFEIDFPIKIFSGKKVNFRNSKFKERILKRNMYYFLYGNKSNQLFNRRKELFLKLASEVKEYVIKNFSHLKIMSVSIFGSSLYSAYNVDYDFLVIVKGNEFDNIDINLDLSKDKCKVGISIKGEQNFTKGIRNKRRKFPKDLQDKIINRTSVSLPVRHLPLWGYDFEYNKKLFLNNCYAQTYDLLSNTYCLYCLKSRKNLNTKRRSQKILSRLFEASKYLSYISNSKYLDNLRKKILSLKARDVPLSQSKKIFNDFVKYYNNKVNV